MGERRKGVAGLLTGNGVRRGKRRMGGIKRGGIQQAGFRYYYSYFYFIPFLDLGGIILIFL
jgi:hypothetical protein